MKIIWYGHSCFRLETGSSVILIDPFLKGNPTFEKSGIAWDDAIKGVTHVALTHGHSDHVGDAGEICKKQGATLFANFELAMYVKSKGAERLEPMNTGGTVAAADFELTLVNALHSSSQDVYLGNPNGIVIRPKNDKTALSHGRHRDVRRHGADRRVPQALDRHRADRRPLHHGRQKRRLRLQEVLRLRDGAAVRTTAPSRACWIRPPTSSSPRWPATTSWCRRSARC